MPKSSAIESKTKSGAQGGAGPSARPRVLPVLPTLKGYQKSWLVADVAAGLTLVAIAIPEQMATAHLANMPAVAGFYAFIAGSLVFALFGRHPRLSVGADSTIAPVFAAGVVAVAATGSRDYTHLVSAVALMVGALLVGAGLLRLGWIADFLPLPVIDGLLAGIGIERQDGTGEEVVALAHVAVFVRAGVAHRPVDRVQLRVVAAGEPRRAAAGRSAARAAPDRTPRRVARGPS